MQQTNASGAIHPECLFGTSKKKNPSRSRQTTKFEASCDKIIVIPFLMLSLCSSIWNLNAFYSFNLHIWHGLFSISTILIRTFANHK